MDDLDEKTPVFMASTGPVHPRLTPVPTAPASSEAMLYRAERLRSAFNAAKMLSWDWDLIAAKSEFSCDYYQFFGFDGPIPAGEGEDPTQLVVHPDDRAPLVAASTKSIQTGVPFDFEFRGARPAEDGGQSWYAARAQVSYDEKGFPNRLVGVTWDITPAKRVEEELERHRGILESIGSNLPDSVLFQMIRDPGGDDRFTYLSAGARRLLDIDARKIPIGFSAFADKLVEHDAARLWMAMDSAIMNKVPVEIELKLRSPDGKILRLLLRAAPRVSDGDAHIFDGIISDLTAHYESQDSRQAIQRRLWEMQKVESLGVLAGGIAHEFNNFLTGIMGHASIMESALPPDSPLQESTESILNASVHAALLCRQMLSYAGKSSVAIEAVDLNLVVRNSIELLRVSVPKGVDIGADIEEEIPPASADANQVSQILMNLVMNGAESVVGNRGKVVISTGVDDEVKGVWIQVEDSGCGMTAEVKRRMFEPFFSTKFAGRGLGLASSKGIVDSLNGSIEVESEPGRGTRVRVTFPIATGKPKAQSIKKKSKPTGREFRGGGTILVVDDEVWGREVLVAMIRPLGFEVDIAVDGEDALTKIHQKNGHYQAVFLDLTMPGRSGQSVFESLRVSYPALPVIIMSGLERIKVGEMFGAAAPQFLEKPFTMDQVMSAIQHALEIEH
jgi:two-component system cell cycle sensor histidine kinase/response regulator CckA